MNKLYTCVYCGHVAIFIEFAIKNKKGLYRFDLVKCPSCKNQMKKRTLTTPMSIEDWCKWLYFNIRSKEHGHETYKKIKWDLLNKNLRKHHINIYFWEIWKNIKQEYSKITDDDYNEFFTKLYGVRKNMKLSDFLRSKDNPTSFDTGEKPVKVGKKEI